MNSNQLIDQQAWLVIPAAGMGQRMQTCVPKQYLKVCGKTILEHTLSVFDQFPNFKQIVLVISPSDIYWKKLHIKTNTKLSTTKGGQQRFDSVLNGLTSIKDQAQDDDWVFVHDAARPCVSVDDITSLFEQLAENTVGGLLAKPVSDTLKLVNAENNCEKTIDRSNLWHALTPQVFRFKLLFDALTKAKSYAHKITDEASAVELYGASPKIVQGEASNIKVTMPDDLAMVEMILRQRQKETQT